MNKKRICLSITAHVDAGKTTLAEAMLYLAGKVNKIGRVDHRSSVLDYEEFERKRGITAFSKQAVLEYGRTEFCIIDTPGHADLFSETRRGLRIPDAAVLVISGSEGIQTDTENLWKLLQEKEMPVWIFVSKMDLTGSDRNAVLNSLQKRFSSAITDFCLPEEQLLEECAALDEPCMDEYLQNNGISDLTMSKAIRARSVIPCFFGSGLRLEGVQPFLSALDRWTLEQNWPEPFSALCYRINRDARGQRQTFLRITGGSLQVRQMLSYRNSRGELLEEKVTGIRIYTGVRFDSTDTVTAGQVCAVLGLSETTSGTPLGAVGRVDESSEESVQRFDLRFSGATDIHDILAHLQELAEELPELSPKAENGIISVCLSGRMQGEMLKSLLFERYDLRMEIADTHFIYRETIQNRVEGVGHFEPLRHYAEVHLLLEPLPSGSGVVLESACPEDVLDRNWQNLILDSLRDCDLRGVLAGAALTDIRICLVSGRAHLKHTEGGDFRQAARRALRQGLMQADCVLLEPVYRFVMELPVDQLGRALSDLRLLHAQFEAPILSDDLARINGSAPASEIADYPETLLSYTRGKGKLHFYSAPYQPCHCKEQVLKEIDYHPERDTEWPADSVFCAHGAGFSVSWDRVKEYMHLPSVLGREERTRYSEQVQLPRIDDRELEEIMLREFGPIRRPVLGKSGESAEKPQTASQEVGNKRTLLIDGYNYIFATPSLRDMARCGLDAARSILMDQLSNYCGVTGYEAVLVFDGYRSVGNPGTRHTHANLRVVFTAEGESADAYIERIASEIGRNDQVAVVTADNMIRISAARFGILRVSPESFAIELSDAEQKLRKILEETNKSAHMSSLAWNVSSLKRKETETT